MWGGQDYRGLVVRIHNDKILMPKPFVRISQYFVEDLYKSFQSEMRAESYSPPEGQYFFCGMSRAADRGVAWRRVRWRLTGVFFFGFND